MIKAIDATGFETVMQYDVQGNLLTKQAGDGKVESTDYDYIHRTKSEEIIPSDGTAKDALLNKKEIYDFMGNVVSSFDRNQKSDGSKSTLETKRSIYDYTNGPRVITQIDDYGNETRMSYDNRGEVIKKEDFHVLNNQNGIQLQKIGETTRDYHFVCDKDYGCYQKVVETKDNENGTGLISTSFVRGKRADKEDEPAVLYSKTVLAKTNEVVKEEKSDYTETGVLLGYQEFDTKGNLVNEKAYHYDGKGRKDREDLKSYVAGTKTPAHQYTLEHQYDQWNDDKEMATILTSPDQNGRFQGYTKYYDVVGRQVKTCYTLSGKEHCTSATFDPADRQIKGVDFNGALMTQSYDPKTGELAKQVYQTGDGNTEDTITYDYNGFGLIAKSAQNNNGIGYYYNAIGLPLYLDYQNDAQMLLKGLRTNIEYDEHNQVAKMSDYNGMNFGYNYFADGRLAREELRNAQGQLMGFIENSFYAFDDKENPQRAGKVKTSTAYFNDGKLSNTQTTTYEYDLQGREIKKTFHDTLGNDTTITTSYDDRNNIASLTYVDRSSLKPDDANMNKIVSYEYDDLKRVTKSTTNISVPNGKWTKEVITYQYDINGNILDEVATTEAQGKTMVRSSHYVDDEIDQLLTKTQTIKENGQVISTKVLTYVYDLNGNMVKILDGDTKAVIAQYIYNSKNQMVKFIDVKNGSLSYEYSYYPGGHRESKTDGKQTVKFYYDTAGHMINEALVNDQGQVVKMSSLFEPFRYLADK